MLFQSIFVSILFMRDKELKHFKNLARCWRAKYCILSKKVNDSVDEAVVDCVLRETDLHKEIMRLKCEVNFQIRDHWKTVDAAWGTSPWGIEPWKFPYPEMEED